MKKILLSIGFAISCLAVTAQSTLVIYSGNKKTDLINGKGFTFDALVVSDTTLPGATDKAMFLTGPGNNDNYVGGYGNAGYGSGGKTRFGAKYAGDFAKSAISFTGFTKGTKTQIKIELKAGAKSWGYIYNLKAGMNAPATFTALASNFKEIVDYQPTGANMTEEELAAVDEVQFVVSLDGKPGTAFLILDNLVLSDVPVVTTPAIPQGGSGSRK